MSWCSWLLNGSLRLRVARNALAARRAGNADNMCCVIGMTGFVYQSQAVDRGIAHYKDLRVIAPEGSVALARENFWVFVPD